MKSRREAAWSRLYAHHHLEVEHWGELAMELDALLSECEDLLQELLQTAEMANRMSGEQSDRIRELLADIAEEHA